MENFIGHGLKVFDQEPGVVWGFHLIELKLIFVKKNLTEFLLFNSQLTDHRETTKLRII